MKTGSTVPAMVTRWRMLWMIITQDTALGPYLKLWKGVNPYHSLVVIKYSVLALIIGFITTLVLAPKNDGVAGFVIGLLGLISTVYGVSFGLIHTQHLNQTVSALQIVWNSQKLGLLALGDFDFSMIKTIMTPGATYWAKEVLRIETSGLDRLPRGRREKSSCKRKVNRYVSACRGMGLGYGVLTHQQLVDTVFKIASSN
jgi:hypothetical protein